MPKQTTEKKTCVKCNFEHPMTWFQPYKLKDGTKVRSSHCKICRESKGSLPSIESWNEQMYKEIISGKENPPLSTPTQSLHRTIRFRYYGANTDLWQNLRKTLLETIPSSKRTTFLETWAKKAGLEHLPRSESVIGDPEIEGKDLRIKETHDAQDLNDIVISNINAGTSYDDPYKKEWNTSEIRDVVRAFISTVPFEGTVTGVLEIHFDETL